MARPGRPRRPIAAGDAFSNLGAWSRTAERVFLQMRVVRDAARNLLSDIDACEAAMRELQDHPTVDDAAVAPPPAPANVSRPQILRIAEVTRQLGLGRSTIYALMQQGQFPAQVRLSEHAVGWKTADIDAWLAARPKP